MSLPAMVGTSSTLGIISAVTNGRRKRALRDGEQSRAASSAVFEADRGRAAEKKTLSTVTFLPGHTILRQGDQGAHAWLILAGDVEVFADDGVGPMRSVARLSSKQMIGEMSLIDNGLRSATVVARTSTTCAEIPRGAFTRLLNACEPLARYMLLHLINAVRAQHGVPITSPAVIGPDIRSTDDRSRILERRMFGPGATIFREGEVGEAAYLIQSGEINVIRGDTLIATLGPGRTFGEIALIRNAKRMASAVVGENGVALEIIRRREFDEAIGSMPMVLQSLVQSYLGYLVGSVSSDSDLDATPLLVPEAIEF